MIDKTMSTNLTKEKSALYPGITIEETIDFIKVIDQLGGKNVSYSSVLEKLGLTNPKTKSFNTKVSTAKQFGFIITVSNTIQLSDSAKLVLYPTGDDIETSKILFESFSKPPLYSKLIREFNNKIIPDKEKLSNILMTQYHIVKSVKDIAADCFLKSANYLNLIIDGVLLYNSDSVAKEDVPLENTIFSSDDVSKMDNSNNLDFNNKNGYHFEIPTLSGNVAEFFIPDGIVDKDIDYIKLYVEKMLPVFLDNLKSEIKKE